MIELFNVLVFVFCLCKLFHFKFCHWLGKKALWWWCNNMYFWCLFPVLLYLFQGNPSHPCWSLFCFRHGAVHEGRRRRGRHHRGISPSVRDYGGKNPFMKFDFISVADPDPGLGAFWPLDPGSGISFFRIPDPGSQDHIFKSFLTIFFVKSSIILWKLAQIFFFSTSKIK